MTRRKAQWSPEDVSLLISLISRHINDVECVATRTVQTRARKATAWLSITKDFNALKKTTRQQASQDELRAMWYRIKAKAKRLRNKAGPNVTLTDWLADATEKIVQKVGQAKTPTRSPSQTPPHLAPDDSTTDSDESNEHNSKASTSEGEERPASRSSTSAAVDYCPRKEFVTTPDNRAPPALEDERMFATFRSGPSIPSCYRPAELRPQVIVDQTSPPTIPATAFHIASTATPAMQSPAPSNVTGTGIFLNPVLAKAYHGPAQTNTLWVPGNVMSSLQHQFCSAQSPLRPTPQSTVTAEEASRSHHHLQAQLQIHHLQTLAAMEKTLYENKMRFHEVSTNLAQELHEAQMKASVAMSEGKLAMEKIMLKRDEEFHALRMRTEEEILSMQRELHDMKMETARIELQQAEISKQIVKVKLKQVELELEDVPLVSSRSDCA